MATQQSIPQCLEQSKLAVVVTIPKQFPNSILQDDLARILEMRQQIESLEEKIKAAEAQVRSALESGAAVEPGLFRAYIKTTERRNVAWKSVVERELGEDYAVRVLAATKPDAYTKLIVEA